VRAECLRRVLFWVTQVDPARELGGETLLSMRLPDSDTADRSCTNAFIRRSCADWIRKIRSSLIVSEAPARAGASAWVTRAAARVGSGSRRARSDRGLLPRPVVSGDERPPLPESVHPTHAYRHLARERLTGSWGPISVRRCPWACRELRRRGRRSPLRMVRMPRGARPYE
jgi:hypothetical protein